MRLIIPLLVFVSPALSFSASMATGLTPMTLLASQSRHGVTQAQAKSQLTQMGIELSVNKLIDFAAQGDQNIVTLLLAADLLPSASDCARRVTALHNAASQGHVELVGNCYRCKPRWTRVLGRAPLVYAAYAGKREVLKLLLA